jgi:hypothetical protein
LLSFSFSELAWRPGRRRSRGNGNPVAHIRNERELNEVAVLEERRLQFAEDMEDRLLDNPEAVEKILRQQGVSRKEQVVRG